MLVRLVPDNLQILIPFLMEPVILDRIMVKRQEREGDFRNKALNIVPIVLGSDSRAVDGVREQVKVQGMVRITFLYFPGPACQIRKVSAPGFVSQELTQQGRMVFDQGGRAVGF